LCLSISIRKDRPSIKSKYLDYNVDCFGLIQLLLIAIERILIRSVAINNILNHMYMKYLFFLTHIIPCEK